MARYRQTPTCHHCGEPIAKAIYQDQSHLPLMVRIIGDTFLRWEYLEHSCKGLTAQQEESKKMIDDHLSKIDANDKIWQILKKPNHP